MPRVTTAQKRAARIADLSLWAEKHADLFDREGDSWRLRDNHSISIRRGYCGYTDFSDDTKGNAIDFLMRHLNYSFTDAVLSLVGDDIPSAYHDPAELFDIRDDGEKPAFTPPQRAESQRVLWGFLCKTRGIPAEVVQALYNKGIMYVYPYSHNGKTYNNIIFYNRGEDWAEVKQTISFDSVKKFRGVYPNSRRGGCWRFRVGENPEKVYICEAAIDAISLACLLGESAYYVSIGGVSNQATIDRIKAGGLPAVLAVDNDEAGDACAARNTDIERLKPPDSVKDWNEALQQANSEDLHDISSII